jgi:hypothetical protein
LDDDTTTGFYVAMITMSAANGFEIWKRYVIRKTATVDSVTQSDLECFSVIPAWAVIGDAMAVSGDLSATMKTSVTTAATSSTPALSSAGVTAITNSILSSALKTNVDAILADTGTDGVVLKAAGLATDAVAEIVDAILASALKTNVDAILADTGTDGVVLKAAGLATDAVTEIAAGVTGATVYGSYTMIQVLRYLLHQMLGKFSGFVGGVGTGVLRDASDSKNVSTIVIDANKNRTTISDVDVT